MGYTCSRKRPYRAEIMISEKKKEILGETASISMEELQEQTEKLIQLMLRKTEYKYPQISIRIFHNEELFLTQNRVA